MTHPYHQKNQRLRVGRAYFPISGRQWSRLKFVAHATLKVNWLGVGATELTNDQASQFADALQAGLDGQVPHPTLTADDIAEAEGREFVQNVVAAIRGNPNQPLSVAEPTASADPASDIARAFAPGTHIDRSLAARQPQTQVERDIAAYFAKGAN